MTIVELTDQHICPSNRCEVYCGYTILYQTRSAFQTFLDLDPIGTHRSFTEVTMMICQLEQINVATQVKLVHEAGEATDDNGNLNS